MVAMAENAVNPDTQEMQVSSDYEKCRQERIKENLERMQKLGIYDLSLKLKSTKPNTRRKTNNRDKTRCISPLPSPLASRRSSRLQNTPAVSYSENVLSKMGHGDDVDELVRENAKPEVYTEEHEKLLGDTKMEWTLFVDGYGKDGKKIYDQVRGKTCHQCRQKTLGLRTHCSKCNLVQGQFCGDCLYMRYGENVIEANQNPDWTCPVCRGICNCSLCRQAKGWAPTGALYRKISNLGYKSVAHYLVQTRRSDPDSVKRSLPFSPEDNVVVTTKETEYEKPAETTSSDKPLCGNVKQESGLESRDKNMDDKASVTHLELQNLECKDDNRDNDEVKNNVVVEPETRKKRRAAMEPVSRVDSIAARLGSRRRCP